MNTQSEDVLCKQVFSQHHRLPLTCQISQSKLQQVQKQLSASLRPGWECVCVCVWCPSRQLQSVSALA